MSAKVFFLSFGGIYGRPNSGKEMLIFSGRWLIISRDEFA